MQNSLGKQNGVSTCTNQKRNRLRRFYQIHKLAPMNPTTEVTPVESQMIDQFPHTLWQKVGEETETGG